MRTVWKTPLELSPLQSVDLPEGAVILKVADQGRHIQMWYEFDWDERDNLQLRHIQITGTGNVELPDKGAEYIDSILIDVYVWHVYERKIL